VARRVEITVIRALAKAQGIQEERAATAKLEVIPTPPPKSTKRAKAVMAAGAACSWLCAVSMIRPFDGSLWETGNPSACATEESTTNGATMAH
jgi:hypothetical protein